MIGVPPTVAVDHSTVSVSPCSPTTIAWTLATLTPRRSASTWRSRDESSTVPLPITRPCGRPDSSWATYVTTSTGLVTNR